MYRQRRIRWAVLLAALPTTIVVLILGAPTKTVLGTGAVVLLDGARTAGASGCSIYVRSVALLGDLTDAASITAPVRVDVAPLPGGTGWLVTDLEGEQNLRYGPEGAYQGVYLPRGQGPGEVEAPARVALDPFDSLWVTHGRGRAVLIGEAGAERTIVSPEQFAVDGHTPSGRPFSTAFWSPLDEGGAPMLGESVAGAIVMDREGGVLYELGPISPIPEGERGIGPTRSMQPISLAAQSDSVFLGPDPTASDVWVSRWTAEGGEPFVYSESIRQALVDPSVGPGIPFDGQTMALISSHGTGIWGLGRLTALTDAEQDRLRRELAEELGLEDASGSYFRYHPAVSNQAHRTVLFHMLDDGTVTEAVLMEGMPRGFVDQDHYFTLRESEMGVLQIRVWRFERRCDEG